MPIVIAMQSNGFKAYIFHITRHHKHESILYCHYTSMLYLVIHIYRNYSHILTLLFPPFKPTQFYHDQIGGPTWNQAAQAGLCLPVLGFCPLYPSHGSQP